MTRKERDFITLRFRKHLDDDLKEAVRNLEDGTLSNLVRDGLRLMLGIRTTKKTEITESVLTIPSYKFRETTNEIPAEGIDPENVDLQRSPLRETKQESWSNQTEAAKFQKKPAAPAPAPYLAKPKH